MIIRAASNDDRSAIWEIIRPTIRAGETYTLDRDLGENDALAYWIAPDRETFVAEENGTILGTYYIRSNRAGGGRHVCNCGYMEDAKASGRAWPARCMSTLSPMLAQRASGPCSSISSSAATNARCDSGSRSDLRSSVGFRKHSFTLRSAMSTPSLCFASFRRALAVDAQTSQRSPCPFRNRPIPQICQPKSRRPIPDPRRHL